MISIHLNILHKLNGVEFSPAPYFDLEEEFELQTKCWPVFIKDMLESAHDVAEGGLFVALAESGFHKNLGF